VKHLTTLLVFLVLLAYAASPAFAAPDFPGGPELIVDDSFGTAAACPGAQFKQIQAAVDAAAPGAKIRVCPGTYAGDIFIDKPLLKLVAKPALQAYIVGEVRGMFIAADDVRVESFDIAAKQFGITVFEANGVDIRLNRVHGSSVEGIGALKSSNGTIRENQLFGNGNDSQFGGGGIGLINTSGFDIKKNVASDNRGAGIILSESSNNQLDSNTSNNNDLNGISLCEGSNNNLIENNKAINNHKIGIEVDGASLLGCVDAGAPSANNTIKKNTISSNGLDADDRTIGAKTAGTANSWQANVCKSSNPFGLCAK
jgi:parallel beta-helix repeat protein